MPTYFQRPENALKRAKELLNVGKKQRALDALYDVIKSKKHKAWQKIHEPIMQLYLELCVLLKKSHIAKEGLFQYRNICQQVNIKSLEDVVREYLRLAEEKTEAARQKSQQQAFLDIDDLDQVTTPEELLLSAVSGEDSQDRTDRVVLIPWVKFLWESYRQCLELLRNNSRVERLYHDIAQQAFKFCLNYSRKTEFRKLCDNLRSHLGQIHRHQHQQTAINLGNPDSQAMHLETRLFQLDSAITMELWQEAYKAIEDVHGLMALGKKSPKPQLMANYYQKLALVFWKAGNHLFHAAALFRLFHLSREMKKNLTAEDLQKMATRVAMATLAIPLPPARSEVDRFLETDESVVEKNRKLAALLGLTNPPTRLSLCKDLIRHNVLPNVIPEIQDLHRWLEVEFHPLELCSRVEKSIHSFEDSKDHEELKQYVPAIQNISVMRLLFQVSQIYQTIDFERLLKLALFVSQFHLETLIVDVARRNDLQVVIDHKKKCLHFGTTLGMSCGFDQGGSRVQSMPGEQIRNQLVQMCDVLLNAVFCIQPTRKQIKNDEVRQRVVAAYKNTADKDHRNILQRRLIIEKRKEDLENQNIQREEEERHLQEIARRNQQMAETERLKREAEERDRQRKLMELKEVQKKQVKDKIEQLKKSDFGARIFQDIDEEELENLDADTIMAKQVEQLDKERKELQTRLKSQEKKIDYMERAKRLEEIPLLQNAYEEFLVKDQEFWEQQEAEYIKEAIADRELALQTSGRLSRIREDKESYFNKLKADRGEDFKLRLEDFKKKLEASKIVRLEERKKKRKVARKLAAQKEKEEEEQRLRDEQLKREREEEERIAAAEKAKMEREYQQRLEKLNEIEAKQKLREQEIERKLREGEDHDTDKDQRGSNTKDFRGSRESANYNQRNDDDMVWRKSGKVEDRAPPTRSVAAKDSSSWRRVPNDDAPSEDAWRKRDDRRDEMPPKNSWSSRDNDRGREDKFFRGGPGRAPPRENDWKRGDDAWGRGEDRPRDDRSKRDERPREDKWHRSEDRGRGDDNWRSKGMSDRRMGEDKWRGNTMDRRPRGDGDSWRRDERNNQDWRREPRDDGGFSNRRRVPADKDGFPADNMPPGGRRAPPPPRDSSKDYDNWRR